MKQTTAKIMAILALLAIIISIVGTGILFLTNRSATPQPVELSEADLQKLIEENKINIETTEGSDNSIEIIENEDATVENEETETPDELEATSENETEETTETAEETEVVTPNPVETAN